MYGCAYDEKDLAMVAMLLGPSQGVADYARLVKSIHDFADVALRNPNKTANVIMYVEAHGPPSANHRKAIAGGAARVSLKNSAFVSDSMIARGINRAILLLAPDRRGTTHSIHATIEEALVWFEKRDPGSSAILSALAAKARASAT